MEKFTQDKKYDFYDWFPQVGGYISNKTTFIFETSFFKAWQILAKTLTSLGGIAFLIYSRPKYTKEILGFITGFNGLVSLLELVDISYLIHFRKFSKNSYIIAGSNSIFWFSQLISVLVNRTKFNHNGRKLALFLSVMSMVPTLAKLIRAYSKKEYRESLTSEFNYTCSPQITLWRILRLLIWGKLLNLPLINYFPKGFIQILLPIPIFGISFVAFLCFIGFAFGINGRVSQHDDEFKVKGLKRVLLKVGMGCSVLVLLWSIFSYFYMISRWNFYWKGIGNNWLSKGSLISMVAGGTFFAIFKSFCKG